MTLAHGTAVAIDGRGVLLRGASGAGKSDLALRLIAQGAILIADDQIELSVRRGVVLASPPATIAGLIELRGVGIRRLPYRGEIPLALVVDLVTAGGIERLPDARTASIRGIVLPLVTLAPFEPSVTAKIVLALQPDAAPAGVPGGVGYKESDMSTSSPMPRHTDAAEMADANVRIVLITGMSGAGRSTALKLLEDLGYEAVDNLPLSLLTRLVRAERVGTRPIAVGIDIRTRDFGVATVVSELEKLIVDGRRDCRMVFLDCDDDALARRYTETRRRHPLAGDRPVMDGIKLERDLVSPLRQKADLVIDTSVLKTADLKRLLAGNFGIGSKPGLKIFVTSFSFRQGLPREADLVFDVRFLENPHYDPALRMGTGLDPAVGAFIAADPNWDHFFSALTALLQPLLPCYDREGKSYLTIAIGCTGGRHRSVYAAERLGRWLETQGQAVAIAHRDTELPPNPNDIASPPALHGGGELG